MENDLSGEQEESSRWVRWVIVGFAAWLFISVIGGWWIWNWQYQKSKEGAKFVSQISLEQLEQEYEKILRFASPRSAHTEAGREGLTRMAAMIEGTLGTANVGYSVSRLEGVSHQDQSWPSLQLSLRGNRQPMLWVICPYDDPTDGEDPSAIVSLMAVAAKVAPLQLGRPVRILFIPDRTGDDLLRRIANWRSPGDLTLWLESTAGQGIKLVSGPAATEEMKQIATAEKLNIAVPQFVQLVIAPQLKEGVVEAEDILESTLELEQTLRMLAK